MSEIPKKVLINGMVKWLDHFYGKDEFIIETDNEILIKPFEYYNHTDDVTTTEYKFRFDKKTGNLHYYIEIALELRSYFNAGGLRIGDALETWFQQKFGFEVSWLGAWD